MDTQARRPPRPPRPSPAPSLELGDASPSAPRAQAVKQGNDGEALVATRRAADAIAALDNALYAKYRQGLFGEPAQSALAPAVALISESPRAPTRAEAPPAFVVTDAAQISPAGRVAQDAIDPPTTPRTPPRHITSSSRGKPLVTPPSRHLSEARMANRSARKPAPPLVVPAVPSTPRSSAAGHPRSPTAPSASIPPPSPGRVPDAVLAHAALVEDGQAAGSPHGRAGSSPSIGKIARLFSRPGPTNGPKSAGGPLSISQPTSFQHIGTGFDALASLPALNQGLAFDGMTGLQSPPAPAASRRAYPPSTSRPPLHRAQSDDSPPSITQMTFAPARSSRKASLPGPSLRNINPPSARTSNVFSAGRPTHKVAASSTSGFGARQRMQSAGSTTNTAASSLPFAYDRSTSSLRSFDSFESRALANSLDPLEACAETPLDGETLQQLLPGADYESPARSKSEDTPRTADGRPVLQHSNGSPTSSIQSHQAVGFAKPILLKAVAGAKGHARRASSDATRKLRKSHSESNVAKGFSRHCQPSSAAMAKTEVEPVPTLNRSPATPTRSPASGDRPLQAPITLWTDIEDRSRSPSQSSDSTVSREMLAISEALQRDRSSGTRSNDSFASVQLPLPSPTGMTGSLSLLPLAFEDTKALDSMALKPSPASHSCGDLLHSRLATSSSMGHTSATSSADHNRHGRLATSSSLGHGSNGSSKKYTFVQALLPGSAAAEAAAAAAAQQQQPSSGAGSVGSGPEIYELSSDDEEDVDNEEGAGSLIREHQANMAAWGLKRPASNLLARYLSQQIHMQDLEQSLARDEPIIDMQLLDVEEAFDPIAFAQGRLRLQMQWTIKIGEAGRTFTGVSTVGCRARELAASTTDPAGWSNYSMGPAKTESGEPARSSVHLDPLLRTPTATTRSDGHSASPSPDLVPAMSTSALLQRQVAASHAMPMTPPKSPRQSMHRDESTPKSRRPSHDPAGVPTISDPRGAANSRATADRSPPSDSPLRKRAHTLSRRTRQPTGELPPSASATNWI